MIEGKVKHPCNMQVSLHLPRPSKLSQAQPGTVLGRGCLGHHEATLTLVVTLPAQKHLQETGRVEAKIYTMKK